MENIFEESINKIFIGGLIGFFIGIIGLLIFIWISSYKENFNIKYYIFGIIAVLILGLILTVGLLLTYKPIKIKSIFPIRPALKVKTVVKPPPLNPPKSDIDTPRSENIPKNTKLSEIKFCDEELPEIYTVDARQPSTNLTHNPEAIRQIVERKIRKSKY